MLPAALAPSSGAPWAAPEAPDVKPSVSEKKSTRKGKWTIEEEEFTTRIIEYFNTGLLELPEGTTLRSYLADKLNCDPMRITKKFSGNLGLGGVGKRVFHASMGRQRDERLSRCASQQTLAAAQRELATLEARFVDAVSRASESKDARMIDLEARFLHSSNVVSTPAIDAFIMQSCGGALWDPDGIASKSRDSESSQSALAAAAAAHLNLDPSAYAEGATAQRYEEPPSDFPLNTVAPTQHSTQPRDAYAQPHPPSSSYYGDAPPGGGYQQQQQHPYDHHHRGYGEYAQQQRQHSPPPQGYHSPHAYAAPAPGSYSPSSVEARFQHLVQHQNDPTFELATRASQDQHQADQQRINRWMAATRKGPSNMLPGAPPHLGGHPGGHPGGPPSAHHPRLPPAHIEVPPAPRFAVASTSSGDRQAVQERLAKTAPHHLGDAALSPPTQGGPVDSGAPRQTMPADHRDDSKPIDATPRRDDAPANDTKTEGVPKDASEGSVLLLGFAKSLTRSESHKELVEFCEDVNKLERKASLNSLVDLERGTKRSANYGSGEDSRRAPKRQAPDVPDR